MTDDTLWHGVGRVCRERYGLCRTKDSLQCRWKTLSRYSYLWITCLTEVRIQEGTGNHSELALTRMVHALFLSRKLNCANPTNVQFKYVDEAEFS